MKRLLVFLFALVVLVLPEFALAQIVPCNGPDCKACHIVALGQNLLNWFILVMASVIGLVFAWGGLKMVTAGGETGAVTSARSMMTNAVIGFLILLSSWLIVDTIFKYFATGADFKAYGVWNEIKCTDDIPRTSGTPTGGATPTGGSCQAAGSGPCSPSALGSVFSDPAVANQASQICMKESANDPASESKVDKLRNEGGKPFSIGLFQINLTVHELVGCGNGGETLNCKSAFSGRNFDARIVNNDLYNQCVAAAKNPECNMTNAYRIKGASNGSWKPWSTASMCSLI
jgi:hypothetical protein